MDTIDVAQQRQQEEIERALAARPTAKVGLAECERIDCGEPITAFRQNLGARLCIDCQHAAELEGRSWARGKG